MKKQYNTRAILASLLICGFVGMFSETALNIAMTNLMEVFQISAASAQWLTTGFLLTLGILMPMSGLLLQRFTTRQLFTGSLTSLILGTLIAALAFNFEMLMVARVLQAAGMALYLLVLAVVPDYWVIDRTEVLGKCQRCHEAPDRSAFCRVVNNRIWRSCLRFQ